MQSIIHFIVFVAVLLGSSMLALGNENYGSNGERWIGREMIILDREVNCLHEDRMPKEQYQSPDQQEMIKRLDIHLQDVEFCSAHEYVGVQGFFSLQFVYMFFYTKRNGYDRFDVPALQSFFLERQFGPRADTAVVVAVPLRMSWNRKVVDLDVVMFDQHGMRKVYFVKIPTTKNDEPYWVYLQLYGDYPYETSAHFFIVSKLNDFLHEHKFKVIPFPDRAKR